jgi:hypothetical protein
MPRKSIISLPDIIQDENIDIFSYFEIKLTEDTCHWLVVTTASGFIVLHAHFSWNLPSPIVHRLKRPLKAI